MFGMLGDVLDKKVFVADDRPCIRVGSQIVAWSARFRLFLVTREENLARFDLQLLARVPFYLFTTFLWHYS